MAKDQGFEKDILGRLTKRDFEEWVRCFRVVMEKLGRVANTKREANRMGMYITNELRRVVRIKHWKEGETQREKEEVLEMLLHPKRVEGKKEIPATNRTNDTNEKEGSS
jgi:hypothetical protein